MIFGKFAIISYIFSAVLLGVSLMLYNALGVQLFAPGTVTEDSLNALIGKHDVSVSPNPQFIFGDYLSGLQAIGGVIFSTVTGGVVGDALSAVPFWTADVSITIIFRVVFTFCTAALIVNILTGREI